MQLYERLAEYNNELEGNELNTYLNSPKAHTTTSNLDYWRGNAATFPILARMARDILAINPTSAPIEREFSKTGDITTPPKRNRLTKTRINQLCCLKSWLSLETNEIELDPLQDSSDDTDYDNFELSGSEK